jgi:hypothetical protein
LFQKVDLCSLTIAHLVPVGIAQVGAKVAVSTVRVPESWESWLLGERFGVDFAELGHVLFGVNCASCSHGEHIHHHDVKEYDGHYAKHDSKVLLAKTR